MSDPPPRVQQQMLIRVPAEKIFDAFVNPEVTTKFWITHSDGTLEVGTTRTWEWRQYGASAPVTAIELNPDRILFEWGEADDRSKVEIKLNERSDGTTLVVITNFDFAASSDNVVPLALDSMGGFSLVLASAKAWLEHGLDLNLVDDRAPDAHVR